MTMHRIPRHNFLANVKRNAFTLIEVLIVVVILGILATVVIPQFSNASKEARENTLKDELRYLRIQIAVFKAQHRDVPPGYPNGDLTAAASESSLLDQLTKYTSEDCKTSATVSNIYKFGPYLSKMPSNPINGLSAVKFVADADELPAPDDATYGWIYKPKTQQIVANSTGNDGNSTPYISY
jgi:general secretion pathway protein G